MDTRKWKPVFRLTITFNEADFSIFIIGTPSRPIAHIPCTMWIPTRGSYPRLVGKCSKYEKSGESEKERERSVLVTAVGRAVFFSRASVSGPPFPRSAERKPTDRDLVWSTLCLRAESANRIDLHERVEICVTDDFSVANISPSVSGR